METYDAQHRFQLPREVVIGRGVISQIGKVCVQLGFGRSPLVLADEITIEIAGNKVLSSLEEQGFQPQKLISKDSTMAQVKEVEKKIRDSNINVVLGVGGGKVVDVAKVSAVKSHIPFISVPTAASHDGISSPRASIKEKHSLPHSIAAKPPTAIVADTEIIAKAPYRLLAAGCGDIISNSTAVMDWELAHKIRNEYYGEYAAALSKMAAKLILKRAHLIRTGMPGSVRIVMEALISSGVAMCIAGSSRPASGAEHLFSHALDKICREADCESPLHGEQCGVGSIMMMYLHGGDWRSIKDALHKIGAPTTAEELRIDKKYVIEALTICHQIRDRYTILGEKGLTKEAATRLAYVTEVIS